MCRSASAAPTEAQPAASTTAAQSAASKLKETAAAHTKTHSETYTKTHTVSPALAAALISLRPQIVHHACRSGKTGRFGDCLVGATLPHTVEHIAIDLLVERFAGPPAQTFAGATTWLDRDQECMRVRVGCTSDNPALYFAATETALIEAAHLINQLLTTEKSGD